MDLEQQNRAYDLAESWANDASRLAALMTENMTVEQYAVICCHLAACFVALTDNTSREQAMRTLIVEVEHIHAEVVESIFLPVAEKLVSQAKSQLRMAA